MRRPPPLSLLPRYPVTVTLGALAIGVTVAWGQRADISYLFMNFRAWQGEVWRLVSSILPHVNLIHLAFNLYWLWVFGTLLEDVFGSLKTLAIILFLAVGSTLAEYSFSVGGVGLSGVGYGLFGLLWMLGRRDDRFQDAVDELTTILFVAWFFLCIILTYLDVMPVGNFAHGSGAFLGLLLGMCIAGRAGRRAVWKSLLCCTMVLTLLTATITRPYVNFSPQTAGEQLAGLGFQDLERGDNESAVKLCKEALRFNDREGDWWHNLGVAYGHLARYEDALAAFRRALDLNPDSVKAQRAVADMKAVFASKSQAQGKDAQAAQLNTEAAQLYREALSLNDRDAKTWYHLGIIHHRLGQIDEAIHAYEKAVALDPSNTSYDSALKALHRAFEKR